MPYGTLNGQINIASSVNGASVNTASASLVSTGQGVNIGASYTGRFLILVMCSGSNNTASDGGIITVYRSTTGIPANGSAVVGTQVLPQAPEISGTSTIPFAITTIDTPGIGSYSYYVAFSNNVGGTFTLNIGLTIIVIEL